MRVTAIAAAGVVLGAACLLGCKGAAPPKAEGAKADEAPRRIQQLTERVGRLECEVASLRKSLEELGRAPEEQAHAAAKQRGETLARPAATRRAANRAPLATRKTTQRTAKPNAVAKREAVARRPAVARPAVAPARQAKAAPRTRAGA